eukprot:COSAG05_NODE_3784_length_1838_cov_2.334675_1_plen_334_part_00
MQDRGEEAGSEDAHDKYGFRIADMQQHKAQQTYYDGRYKSAVEQQRARWTEWLADNPLAIRDTEFTTRPFQKGEARQVKELVALARKGIPPERRGMVWLGVSGGRAKLEASRNGKETPYSDLQHQELAEGTDEWDLLEKARHEVEKDLRRTFPKHKTLSTDVQQGKLRNILTSYAKRNPRVGYVQSMNYIVALLLLFMEEDEAFWTLVSIVEDLLPDSFYADNMNSLLMELDLFDELLRKKLPALARHFDRLSLDIKTVCSQWFLLVFVNVLPLESVLRVWDSFFVEGSAILFRVGLGILEYAAPPPRSSAPQHCSTAPSPCRRATRVRSRQP